MAGCGKTVLCSTIVDDLRTYCEGRDDTALAAFYFTFSDTSKQSCEGLLRSLLLQIGWKEQVMTILEQKCDSNRSTLGRGDLEKLLILALQTHDFAMIVLDALDESPETSETRSLMLESVSRILQKAPNVRLLATSRDAPDIRESMLLIPAQPVPIASSIVDKDIRKYVSTQLKHGPLSRLDLEMRTTIEETIANRSRGM
jgi:hypothetical protein